MTGDPLSRVRVRVHPGSKVPRLTVTPEHLEVYVRSRAREGAATREALAAVAEVLKTAPSSVTCRHGEHSRTKLFEVTDPEAQATLRKLLESAREP